MPVNVCEIEQDQSSSSGGLDVGIVTPFLHDDDDDVVQASSSSFLLRHSWAAVARVNFRGEMIGGNAKSDSDHVGFRGRLQRSQEAGRSDNSLQLCVKERSMLGL